MSFNIANQYAYSLASTLMTVIIVFRAGDGSFSVVPASEFDGDEADVIREIDPFSD